MANTETINLTTALQQASILNDRIEKAIHGSIHGAIVEGDQRKVKDARFKSEQEVIERARADNQSITQLIARRNAIRAAVVEKNATTQVNIGGIQMSIAAAVERKRNIHLDQLQLQKMKESWAALLRNKDQLTKELDKKVYDLTQKQYEGENGGPGKQPTEEQILSVKSGQYKSYGPDIVDPLSLEEAIRTMQKSIEDFSDNVDNELSKVNALTEITISY